MEIKTITAKLKHVGAEDYSRYGNAMYFIMRFKGIDGKYYRLLPSSDTQEYQEWKRIAKENIEKVFFGLQMLGRKDRNGYELLNKRVLPSNIECEKNNQQSLI